jgi:hypothetical protein
MAWTIHAYGEAVDEIWDDIVNREALELLDLAGTSIGCANLIGWLKAVGAGSASPLFEPHTHVDKDKLHYRADDGAIVIFSLFDKRLLLVLLFGRSASAHAKVADLNMAARRLNKWRSQNGSAARQA